MTTQVLIEAIVRQATILIAHLATAGGARTPLGTIATQVFAELARELERQGVSRRVAADMFGVALRTYRRRIQRLAESETMLGRSLWEAVHGFITGRHVVTRAELMAHFHKDDPELMRGVLQDLVDGGLVYRAGRGDTASYRAATPADLEHVERTAQSDESIDTLVWAMVYREGPVTREALLERISVPPHAIDAALKRLVASGRVTEAHANGTTRYASENFLMPLGASHGWEAAVFDHFKAVTTTLCAKLGGDMPPALNDHVGGSTYTLEVWPGHPFEAEALGALTRFREELGKLRGKIAAHNKDRLLPSNGPVWSFTADSASSSTRNMMKTLRSPETRRLRRAAIASLIAAVTACGAKAGGEGSESHFACRQNADCEPLGPHFSCEDGTCTRVADDASVGGGGAGGSPSTGGAGAGGIGGSLSTGGTEPDGSTPYAACPDVNDAPPIVDSQSLRDELSDDDGVRGLAALRAQVLQSRDVWQQYAAAHGDTYRYVREFHSFMGDFCETTIEVQAGAVTSRTQWQEEPGAGYTTWTETGADIGTHQNACYPAVTMDALYEECLTNVLCKGPAENWIYVDIDARGLLVQCGFFPISCADDCFEGITPLILTADGTDWTTPLPGCCAPSAEPDCSMNYGGPDNGFCSDSHDGMPWPGPGWYVTIDSAGCFSWVEPPETAECCGCSVPDGGL